MNTHMNVGTSGHQESHRDASVFFNPETDSDQNDETQVIVYEKRERPKVCTAAARIRGQGPVA